MDNKNIKAVKYFFKEYTILAALIVLVLVTAIVEPKFYSSLNLSNIMRQFGPLSLVSLGMTFVIIGGFIDLSLAGIISLVAVVTFHLIDPIGQIPALIVGICLGAAAGYINSLLIISSGAMRLADGLFITFGMSVICGALAMIISGGITRHMFWLKTDPLFYKMIGSGSVGFLSISFLIFLGCLVLLYIFQSKTYMGRIISLAGGNKTVAKLSGISVNRSINIMFIISGVMAAIAAIVLFSRTTTASPVLGKGYELNAILAVVIGGTTLKGGKGSVLRTVLGVMLVTLLSNCMNLLGISSFVQNIMRGAILIAAIWLDSRKEV